MYTRYRRFSKGSFNRPANAGSFNHSRPSQRNKLGKDTSIFVKKANQSLPQTDSTPSTSSFTDFSLAEILAQNIAHKGFKIPTPIQESAIGPILEGRDLIGLANTGTGKTAAFLIPIINNIYKDRNKKALIITPTRELALQINDDLRSLASGMKIYSALIIGGANIRRQIHDVTMNPHVVVGTPGRIRDLISQKILYLEDYSIFVLDEVDLMVDIGFINDIRYFVSLLPRERQSLFFSATISPKTKLILDSFVKDPVTVSVKKQDTSENVDQDVIKVNSPLNKVDQLHDLLIKDGFDKVLIFGRTKYSIDKLHRELDSRGFKVGAIHGSKTQGHRKRVLEDFKRDQIQILLATDLASRGLDIPNVTHVINYEIPDTYDDYIHRIGRTGRADKKGIALTFVD